MLTGFQSGDTTATYTYGVDGMRKRKTVNGVETDYVWENGMLIGEEIDYEDVIVYGYGADGVVKAYKAYGENEGTTQVYIKNGHGDILKTVNDENVVSANIDYDAFGNEVENTSYTGSLGYAGEYQDDESGLIYLRNRYYDPSIGRFISEDPAKDGLNWYVYCRNNPIKYVDPSGKSAEMLTIPWVRQQLIWMNGVRALDMLNYDMSAQMLHHSIRWFSANDVHITEYTDGVNVTGTDRIDGELIVKSLENNSAINNEIEWNISCFEKGGLDHFETDKMVLSLNDTTDLYLSFNNATVKLIGDKQLDGSWIVQVSVHDIYDFDIEKLNNINSVKTAIGGAAGTAAALEEIPLMGAIKTYDIYVDYSVKR